MRLSTQRLELVAMDVDSAELAVGENARLAAHLDASIPDDWPPEHIDAQSIGFMRDLMRDTEQPGWWLWFVVRCADGGARRLIGTAGYKGPVDTAGTVEVGYSVVPSEQCRGYATEAVARLIERAWTTPGIRRVIGETLPHLTPSIRVMEKLGFTFTGPGSEEGVIRYHLDRPANPPI
ncbi:MAG TPA: GNAT family protein [Phycisphaerae bacterium]|nr:GNAT family N-acetyltransferase [Phycisphaerales bacterium]HRX84040.1 GNAT family protein [Phycisphaerae bacterium]